MNQAEMMLALGKMQGTLEAVAKSQGEIKERLETIDTRLREVEKQAVRHGAVSGGIVSGFVMLAKALLSGAGGPGTGA